MAEFDSVARAPDRTTLRMSEDHNEFCTRSCASELETSQDVLVENISGDSNAEDVTQPLIEDQLGRRSGVDTAQDRSERPLPIAGLIDLLQKVAIGFQIRAETRIAIFEDL